MKSSKLFPALLLAAAQALAIAPVAALPSDRQQPIEVTANSAVQEGDLVTYTGEVVIVQGSLRIDADRVVVHNQDRKVQRIIATGDRAHLQQLPEPDGELVKARARRITYLQADDLVILEENAEVEQKGSIVTGKRIDYLVASQTVRAQGGDGGDRVQMVLQPESDTGTPAPTDRSADPAATQP